MVAVDGLFEGSVRMKRIFLIGALCCLAASLWASEPTQQWTATQGGDGEPTQQWTATRQPRTTDKPLPSSGQGASFTLFDRETTPLSLGLVAPVQLPWGDWNVRGVRVSLLYGRCSDLTGLDLGLWNTVNEDAVGLQMGVVNAVARLNGVQAGCFNGAIYFKGLQVGLINYAEGARGIQIGLINVITNTGLGGLPFVYGSF